MLCGRRHLTGGFEWCHRQSRPEIELVGTSNCHWTPQAPFHGACQRDLMAKDEPSRSFLHRWSSRTKAKPDVSVRGATVPQNQESPSFHTCSGSRPGHKVPCEKAGRPTLTGACSYTRWEPRAPAA